LEAKELERSEVGGKDHATDTHRHKKEVKVGGERAEGSKLTAQRRESKKTG
jgi:hypothetical protein